MEPKTETKAKKPATEVTAIGVRKLSKGTRNEVLRAALLCNECLSAIGTKLYTIQQLHQANSVTRILATNAEEYLSILRHDISHIFERINENIDLNTLCELLSYHHENNVNS